MVKLYKLLRDTTRAKTAKALVTEKKSIPVIMFLIINIMAITEIMMAE
ncbi:hypothetical protein LIT38_04115 [Bacillus sp. CMF12]|nr:hypothetical protein [Bacillus sp. CMF12]USK50656.1 hypothetical protein LIT38_04115 [Bacillus sp. CMF12]